MIFFINESKEKLFSLHQTIKPLFHVFCITVLLMIKRHHFEQIKEVVPAIVRVWEKVSTESDEEDSDLEDLFRRAINIANSMQTVRQKLVCDP